jgi:hypothetical protein
MNNHTKSSHPKINNYFLINFLMLLNFNEKKIYLLFIRQFSTKNQF